MPSIGDRKGFGGIRQIFFVPRNKSGRTTSSRGTARGQLDAVLPRHARFRVWPFVQSGRRAAVGSLVRFGICGLAAARPVLVIQSTGPKIVRWVHPVATIRRNAYPAATGCLSFVMESPPQDAGLSDALGPIGPNQWGEVTAALTVARCAAGSRKSDATDYGGGGKGRG